MSGIPAFVSAGIGYVAGLVVAAYLGRRIAQAALRGFEHTAQRRTVMRAAAGGGVVGLAPALLLGMVVGATLGSLAGERLAGSLGGAGAGTVLGVAGGVFAVVSFVMCLAIAAGAWLGRSLARDGF